MLNPNIDELFSGSIDIQLHSGPDRTPERVDAVEAAEQSADFGMKAIVLKNHSHPTAPAAIIAREMVPEVEMFDFCNCS